MNKRDDFEPDRNTPTTNGLLPAGTVIDGRYEVIELLTRSSNVQTYKANHQLIGRVVSLTVICLPADAIAERRERFKRKAKTLSSIEHPNILAFRDFGQTTDGQLFIVKDFVEGNVLSDVIRKGGGLSAERTVGLVSQLLSAIEEIHAHGLLLGELAPEHILLTADQASDEQLRLTEFGIRTLASELTINEYFEVQLNQAERRLHYISPEQLQGLAVDARSDIYCVGCLMHEMLTGDNVAAAADIKDGACAGMPIQVTACIAPKLKAIVQKATAKDVSQRFQKAAEMKEAIDALASASPASDRKMHQLIAFRPVSLAALSLVLTVIAILSIGTASWFWYLHTEEGATQMADCLINLPADESVVDVWFRVGDVLRSSRLYRPASKIYRHMITAGKLTSLQSVDCYLDRAECEVALGMEANDALKHAADRLISLSKVAFEKNDLTMRDILKAKLIRLSKFSIAGNDAVYIASCLSILGDYYYNEKQWQEAVTSYTMALRQFEAFGSGRLVNVLHALHGVRSSFERLNRTSEAIGLSTREIALSKQLFGANSRQTASVIEELADLHGRCGQIEQALDLLKQAARIYNEQVPVDSIDLARIYAKCGHSLDQLSRPPAALECWLKSLSALESQPKQDDSAIAAVLVSIGNEQALLKRFTESERSYRRAIDLYRSTSGTSDKYAFVYSSLASQLSQQGRTNEADKYRLEAKRYFQAAGSGYDRHIAFLSYQLGHSYFVKRRFKEAKSQLAEAVHLYKMHDDLAREGARALLELSDIAALEGNLKQSESYKLEAERSSRK